MTDAESAIARKEVYAFFSRLLLSPPTVDLIEQMRDPELVAALGNLMGGYSNKPFNELLADTRETEGSIAAISQDFEDLFNVPGPKYVKPYEAVYRDERRVGEKVVKGLLYGSSTDGVIQYYHVAGLEVSAEFPELPDHMALELHFMAYLCEKESEAWEESDLDLLERIRQTQLGFLQDHLLCWVDDFTDAIIDNASTPFFRCVGQAINGFTKDDYALLKGP